MSSKMADSTSKGLQKPIPENLEFYQVDMNFINNAKIHSILNHVPVFLQTQLQGNPLMDELGIWQMLNEQNLIETKDKKEFKNVLKRGVKVLIFSTIVSAMLNMGLTRLKIRGRRFINLTMFLRLPVRFAIFGLNYYLFIVGFLFNHMIRLHFYMNYKYSDRFKLYNETGDPLVMNPLFLNDPTYKPEEAESKKILYEKVKQTQLMMNMQSKEFEKMLEAEKKNKKI